MSLRTRRLFACLLSLVMVAWSPVQAWATSYVWNGSSANWSSTTGWSPTAPATGPIVTDGATFDNTGIAQNNVNLGAQNILTLNFTNTSGLYTLSGTSLNVSGAGLISLAGTGSATISAPVTFNANNVATVVSAGPGAGTLTFGALTYAGGTVGSSLTFTNNSSNTITATSLNVTGSTLTVLANGSGNVSLGTTTLTGGNTFTNSGAGTFTLGAVNGSVATNGASVFNNTGSGSFVMGLFTPNNPGSTTGSETFNNTSTGAGTTFTLGGVAETSGGTTSLAFNGTGQMAVTGALSQVSGAGSISVTINNTSSVTLKAANTYGSVAVNAGSLIADYTAANNILTTAKTVTLNGATLALLGKSGAASTQATFPISLTGNTSDYLTLTSPASGTLGVTATLARGVSSTLGVTFTGTNSPTLTFTGLASGLVPYMAVTDSAGVTGFGLSTAGVISRVTTTPLLVTGNTTTDYSLVLANNTFAFTDATPQTINSLAISNTGGAGIFDLTGATLQLNQNAIVTSSSDSSPITIQNGTINKGTLGTEFIFNQVSPGNVTVSTGIQSSLITITKGGAGPLTFTGATLASMSTLSTLAIGGGTLTFLEPGNGGRRTFNRVIAGTGNLAVSSAAGNSTTILTATETFTGSTTINSGATLQIGDGGATGSLAGSVVINSGGALTFNRSDTALNVSGNLISGTGTLNFTGGGSFSLLGNVTLGSFTGTVNVANGTTLAIGGGNSVGTTGNSSLNIVNNGQVTFNSNVGGPFLANVSGTGGFTSFSSGPNVHGLNTYTGGTFALASTLTATYDINLTDVLPSNGDVTFGSTTTGPGGLTLVGNTGATAVTTQNFGALNLSIGSTGTLTLTGGAAGATLNANIGSFNRAAGGTLVLATAGSGARNFNYVGPAAGTLYPYITIGSAFAVENGTNTGIIALTGQTVLAAGSDSATTNFTEAAGVTLDNSVSVHNAKTLAITATSALNLGGQTLQLASNALISAGTNSISSGTLAASSSSSELIVNVTSATTLTINPTVTISAGDLTKGGPGTLVLSSATGSGYTGNTYIGGGTLNLTETGNRTYSGNIIGTGAFTYTGTASTLILTGTNSYSGVTTIASGTLQFGNGTTIGTLGSLTSGIVDNGVLSINHSDTVTYLGGNFASISGTGELHQDGSGTTIVTGIATTYSGATKVNAGTLQFGNGGTFGGIAATTAVTVASSTNLVFNTSSAIAFSNSLAGSGLFSQIGSGTTTISGAQKAFTGNFSVTGGVLALNDATATTGISSSSPNVALGNSTLQVIGTTTATAQPLNAVTLTAGTQGTILLTQAAAGTNTVTAASLSRPVGSTLLITSLNAAGTGVFKDTADTPGSGSTLLPYATYNNAATTGYGLATVATTGVVSALAGQTTMASGGAISAPSTDYIVTGGTVTMTGAVNVNTLTVTASGTTTVNLTGTNTFTSGVLMFAPGAHSGIVAGGTLVNNIANNNALPDEFIVHAWGNSGVASATAEISSAISNGTLTIDGNLPLLLDSATGYAGNVNNLTSGTIVTLKNNSGTDASTLAGAGGFAFTPSAPLTLSATNTYTGSTKLTAGTLVVSTLANGGSNSNIGASTNVAANLTIGGTLQFAPAATSTPSSTDRLFTLSGAAPAIDASGAAGSTVSFTNTGTILFGATNVATTLTFQGTNSGQNTFTPQITDNIGGATAVTKTGLGTWVFTGTKIYTGVTTVNQGILQVDGSLENTQVTVSSGTNATLAGRGSIAGAVSIGSGGILSPGSAVTPVGTFSFGNSLTLGGGFSFDLGSATTTANPTAPLTGNDLIKLTGAASTLTLGGTLSLNSNTATLSGAQANYIPLFQYTAGDTITGSFATLPTVGGYTSSISNDTTNHLVDLVLTPTGGGTPAPAMAFTTANNLRALVSTSVSIAGNVTNPSSGGATATFTSNGSGLTNGGGALTVSGLSPSGVITVPVDGSQPFTGSAATGATAGSQTYTVSVTDGVNSASATQNIAVVNQRSFTVGTPTIALGNFLVGSLPAGSSAISSSGLNAVTANADLGAFVGTGTGSLTLTTGDSTAFHGATSSQTANYTLGGSITSGNITGSFSSPVTAEFGTIPNVAVNLTGTAYDPASLSGNFSLVTPVTAGNSLTLTNASGTFRAAAEVVTVTYQSSGTSTSTSGFSSAAFASPIAAGSTSSSLVGFNPTGRIAGTLYDVVNVVAQNDHTIAGATAGDLGTKQYLISTTVAPHQQVANTPESAYLYSGQSYTNLSTYDSATAGVLGHTATIRYINPTGNPTLTFNWNPTPSSFAGNPTAVTYANQLGSDRLDVSGINGQLYVLQMSYDPTKFAPGIADSAIELVYYNTTDAKWEAAVEGNTGGSPAFYDESYDTFLAAKPGATTIDAYLAANLGAYGTDSSTDQAWAIVNHNSEFAVVPEPSSLVLLAFGALAGFGLWRKKKFVVGK